MKAPEYLAINPMGKVPALRHGGTVVTDAPRSAAIWPMRSRMPDWRRRPATGCAGPTIAGCSSPPVRSKRPRPSGARPEVPAERKAMVGFGSLADVMSALEAAVSGREYLVGDRFTAADVYVGSHIGWGMSFGAIEQRPAFERYFERISARPAAIRAREIDDALIADANRRPAHDRARASARLPRSRASGRLTNRGPLVTVVANGAFMQERRHEKKGGIGAMADPRAEGDGGLARAQARPLHRRVRDPRHRPDPEGRRLRLRAVRHRALGLRLRDHQERHALHAGGRPADHRAGAVQGVPPHRARRRHGCRGRDAADGRLAPRRRARSSTA